MIKAFIGVGSNIEPEHNVIRALGLLRREVHVKAISTFYRAQPFDRHDQPSFYNGVIEIETELSQSRLVDRLHDIEDDLGRKRDDDRYTPRTIDLDVLVYGETIARTDEIKSRPFVSIPLAELAPDLPLPDGVTPRKIAVEFVDHTMEPLAEYTEQLRKELPDGH